MNGYDAVQTKTGKLRIYGNDEGCARMACGSVLNKTIL